MSIQAVWRVPRSAALGLMVGGLLLAGTSWALAGDWVQATGNLANLASECANLCGIFPVPNSDKVIAGVAGARLWVTTNGGAMWTKMGGLAAHIRNRPQQILFDPISCDMTLPPE
jgi:photosystem II stability/assembly factor-like uncharacterized protein